MDGDLFDEQAFDRWLAGDPQRASVFEGMRRRLLGPEMDSALQTYQRREATRRVAKAGAMVAAAVVGLAYVSIPAMQLQLAEPQRYAAGRTVRTVALADGSRITLAAGTSIAVRYTDHERYIDLSHGTIFADVAHEANRPFRIHAGDAQIEDLGTSFEVQSRPGLVRVAVASGNVRFGRDSWFDTPIDLVAHEAARLDGDDLVRTADVDPGAVARWRGEWAEYHSTPLSQVVADLQSVSPLLIAIADRSLANRPVSGRIRLTDPVEQLHNLAIIHGFRLSRSGDRIVLARN